ncbi:outer membrane lipoprotein carrier protein LolA [Desulfosarcina sp. OttesenSCG-928-A07]|nr:outer membrane lipoprotein carrier protein LolA [Desulfosarcina sp. OttesenSCG-928-G17]MDL2328584.1 outer membrane lipoprotein carrier protein LolA [Desulfosarcina sp. OttesenSCG-928-A07]
MGWADTWEDLQTETGAITSIQTDFVQTKHLPILARPLVSQGKLAFQTPGSLRWEYTAPIHSILVMHKGKIRRLTLDTRTHEFREESGAGLDVMQMVVAEISQWMTGRFEDNAMFSVELAPSRKILLTPKGGIADILNRVELWLGDEPGQIRRVRIVEGENAFTDLAFSNTTINSEISDDVFVKVP